MSNKVKWKVGMLALHEDSETWGLNELREVVKDEDGNGRVLTRFVSRPLDRQQWVLGKFLRVATAEVVELARTEGLLDKEEVDGESLPGC